MVAGYSSSMLVKGLLASGVVPLLIRLGKPGVLRLLNISMLAVVLWNSIWLYLL